MYGILFLQDSRAIAGRNHLPKSKKAFKNAGESAIGHASCGRQYSTETLFQKPKSGCERALPRRITFVIPGRAAGKETVRKAPLAQGPIGILQVFRTNRPIMSGENGFTSNYLR